jgi:hypothetical protein
MPELNLFLKIFFYRSRLLNIYTPLNIAHHQAIKKPSKGGAMLGQTQAITAYHFVIYTK